MLTQAQALFRALQTCKHADDARRPIVHMHGIYRPFVITPKHAHRRNERVANAHNTSGIHTHCASEGRRAHDSKCSAQRRTGAGWAEREGPGCGAISCLARPR